MVGSLESTKQLWVLSERHAIFAKLPCQNRQYNYHIFWTQFYQGNKFYNNYNKKIIIKIVTLVKVFGKAPWCRRCQHRAHHNRTPPG